MLGKQLALGQTPSCWPKRLQHAAAGPAAAPVFVAPTGGWDEVCHSKPFRVCQQYRTERKAQQDPPISPPTKSASVRLNWADLSSSSVPAMIFFVLKRQPESFVGRCINKVRLSSSLVRPSWLSLHHARLLLRLRVFAGPFPLLVNGNSIRALLCVYTGK
jgi:hypothetical protein